VPDQNPPDNTRQWAAPRPAGTNGQSVAALVLGIASLVLCPLLGIGAVIVGTLARSETSRTGQAGYGLALTGLILGWIAVAVMILFCLMFVLGVSLFGIGASG
jgi:hypothetical protein